MSDLNSNLRRRAIAWAGQLTSRARGYAPEHLKSAIHSKVETLGEGTYMIVLGVENSRPTHPGQPNFGTSDARAQEYGSGKNAQRGPKTNYDIVPVERPQLIFPGTHEFAGMTIYTQHVSHPGIAAANGGQGYLRPAIKDLRKRMHKELEEDVQDAIRTTMRLMFKGFENGK